MKMSELKVGMFCVVERRMAGKKSLCIVVSGIYSDDSDFSIISFAGEDSWCMARTLEDEELSVVFTADSNGGFSKVLKLETIPTVDELKNIGCTILYAKDDKASKIKARIDTLHSELNQLTEELNNL